MVYCESCGASNPAEAEICFACQLPLALTLDEVSAGSAALHEHGYKILQQVGTGGFGAVYKAIALQTNKPVAIKEIKLRGLSAQEMIDATDTFNREVQILSQLSHMNLPHIHDHFTDPEHWYLVMDFIEGQTLETLLQARSGILSLSDFFFIGIQLCNVLQYLHTYDPPVIFRDLKPSNIMLTPYQQVYLIDFGTARFFKRGQARDTIAFGSPGYAAPEQYGKAQTTPRSDIYSLGATLHTMLTGNDPAETPFKFTPLRRSNAALPQELEALVARMVQLLAEDRPASVDEVLGELERIEAKYVRQLYAYSGTASPLYKPPITYWTPQPVSGSGQIQIQAGQFAAPSPKRQNGRRIFLGGLLALGVSVAVLQQLPASSHSDVSYGGITDYYQAPTQVTRALYVYQQHKLRVSTVAWHPSRPLVASGSWDHTVQVWNAAGGEQLQIYRGHTEHVNKVSWSPDGQFVASASDDQTVQIWDGMTGKTLTTYKGHQASVKDLAWSPNGEFIASLDGAQIHIWNALSGTLLTTRQESSQRIDAIQWLASGAFAEACLAMCIGGRASVWGIVSNETLLDRDFSKDWGTPTLIACSPDGRYMALSGNLRNDAILVQPLNDSSADPAITYTAHGQQVTALTWSPDSQYIASASLDQSVRVWNPYTGMTNYIYQHPAAPYAVSWSNVTRSLVTGVDNSTAMIWSTIQSSRKRYKRHERPDSWPRSQPGDQTDPADTR
ncbi:hypothetical protein EPA93_35780 [Ktedonosporobacter rubrisoli]|uniref:Protein kinase domain-containing protein n=1 Tax=Ktedonosporobacter rubrisoli TaxID=2509675 RepID=A0A4P6JZJ6_KTERU|nr:serine/threonine-protein kinase [Ktedonosporobacter rubrisoli]QBD81045.1 hypothetical protein EPA93_35780 [Ktedonosporobacter rubrisoli]